jgi:hypothetical protein
MYNCKSRMHTQKLIPLLVGILLITLSAIWISRLPHIQLSISGIPDDVSTTISWYSTEEFLLKGIFRQEVTYSLQTITNPNVATQQNIELPILFPKSLLISIQSSEREDMQCTICLKASDGKPVCHEKHINSDSASCKNNLCTYSTTLDIPLLPINAYTIVPFVILIFAVGTMAIYITKLIPDIKRLLSRLTHSTPMQHIESFFSNNISENHLIRFDRKVILVLVLLFILFLTAVITETHSSSVYQWNLYLGPTHQQDGVILGSPKAIRSDEWLVRTPFEFSQAASGFPEKNPTVGSEKSPLAMNIPTKGWTIIFRPQMWGYFLFGAERGFAFNWDLTALTMFTGVFLLLLIWTKNNFWISLLGATWFFFASYTQWWFSSVAGIVGTYALLHIGVLYLLCSARRSNIVVGSLVAIGSLINFALFLYPPFQIPLGYLLLFSTLGFCFEARQIVLDRKNRMFRVVVCVFSAMLASFLMYLLFSELKATIEVIASTVYPGERSITGGSLSVSRLFSGLYTFFITQFHFLPTLGNVSESSNFILLSPFILPLFAFHSYKAKLRIPWTVIALSLYLILLTLWTVLPFPLSISHILLLSKVPESRVLLAIGMTDLLLGVLLIRELVGAHINRWHLSGYAVFIFVASLFIGTSIFTTNPGYVPGAFVIAISILFTVGLVSLFTRKKVLSVLIALVFIIPNMLVNPISTGVNVFEDNELKVLVDTHSDGRWAIYGNAAYASLLSAYGADVFNGVKYPPDLESLTPFDPLTTYETVYNRFAHISLDFPDGRNDIFTLQYPDAYMLRIDPCSQAVKQSDISYILFTYNPEEKLACGSLIFQRVDPPVTLYVYTLQD